MKRNLATLAVASLVALVLGEALVRLADPPALRPESRFFFVSTPPLKDADGIFRFPPHREVRHVVVTRAGIEVDVRYRTNNLGLIDHRDYARESTAVRRIFFLGDSYAAGVEGGVPWIPRLRDETGSELYNLGIGVTGVQHFRTMFAKMSPHLPRPTEIVIVAISNDFLRREWFPDAGEKAVWVCDDGEARDACRVRAPYAHLIPKDAGSAEILARADAMRRDGPLEGERLTLRRTLRASHLLLLAKRFAETRLAGKGTERGETFRRNLEALAEIRRLAGGSPVRFFHVPDVHEARARRYEFDIAQRIAAAGIEYVPTLTECGMTSDVYFPMDNHPNAGGYRRLGDCVGRRLGLMP